MDVVRTSRELTAQTSIEESNLRLQFAYTLLRAGFYIVWWLKFIANCEIMSEEKIFKKRFFLKPPLLISWYKIIRKNKKLTVWIPITALAPRVRTTLHN